MKIHVRLLWVNLFLALTPFAAQAAIGINADTYSIPADGILAVEPDGVLANDTMNDVDNTPQFVLDIAKNHTITVVTPPTEGTLKCGTEVNTICADGSFNFTVSPTTFSGVDSFTYKLEVDVGLGTYEFAETTVFLKACSTTGTETICWTEGSFFDALAATEDPQNPYYVKHEGFEGAAWNNYRSYQDANFNWIYNQATTITSKGIDWSSNHPATNFISTSTGSAYTGTYGIFDPDHGYATNTSTGECQALETANNGVVPPECLPYDGVSGTSTTLLYAAGGYIKGSNSAANIEIITDGGVPNNIGKLVTPAHQFYGVINTAGFNSFQFRDIDGKTGQPLFIFGDDFYLVSRNAADANQAPVIAAVTDQTIEAGGVFDITIPVSDPDGDAISTTFTGIPIASTTNPRLFENDGSIRIRWFSPVDATGTYPVTITITDNGYPGLSTVLNFQLTVTQPPPTLNLPGNITAEATSASGATVNYTSSATDVTDGDLPSGCSPASGSNFALGTTTVNCSVTNSSNLTTTGSFTVLVSDTTAPVVTAPPAIVREATAVTTAVTLDSGNVAAASDLVSGTLTPLPNNTGPFSVGVHTIIWSAIDSAGNIGSATQTVTIIDTSAPSISLPANMTVEATGPTGAIVSYSVTGTDTVDGSITGVCTPASGVNFGLVLTTVNCSVNDTAGNSASGSFTVNVVDTTAPVVTAPLNITMEATGATTAVTLGSASASDVVSGTLTPSANNTGPFAVGVHTITWSATDLANNTGTATQIVTITDTAAPTLNLPANISQGATSTTGAVVNYTVTANDIAEGIVAASCAPVSGSTFTLGTTAVNCSASDSSNNSTTGSFNVTITDTGAPTLSLPANISTEATASTGAIVTYSATASDVIDGPLAASCLPASGSTFALGDHVVNCSAQDLQGNTSNGSFIVSVVDTTTPDVTAPANVNVEATGATTPVTLGIATASDLVSGTLTPVASNSGPFTVGVHTITWSATDAANNTGTAIQTVTITDSTAPVLSMPTGITQEATSAAGAVVNYSVSANDIVDGAMTASCLPVSGSTFALGITAVSCSVTDAAKLTTTGSFNVTIVDTQAPTVTAPANISMEASGTTTVVALGTATATDIVSGVLPATADNTGPFVVGVHTINWSATDNANNTGSATQIVTITDIGSPTLSLPANITAEATSASGVLVSYTVTASDVVDGALTASCTPLSGTTFALGDTIVNCSATDSSNQTTSGSFSVTVVDTTGPALTLPADISVKSTASTGAIVSFTASATDAVDGPIVPNCSPVSGSNFVLGATIVNCSATDGANNTTVGSFNVTVIDATVNHAPIANAGSPQTVSAGSPATLNGSASSDPDGDVITYQWTLVSKPQGSVSEIDVVQATMQIASFNPDKSGVYEAQLIVTDSNNSRSLASRVTITVVNNAPVANAGTDRTVVVGDSVILDGALSSDANGDNMTYQWALTVPTGSAAALTQATSVTSQFTADVAGVYTSQLIVDDGNVKSTADTVVITAQEPVDVAPTITVPADISVDSTGYLTPVNLGVATATDPEDGALQPTADNTGPFTTGRHVITWSVTDSGNNTVTATQTVDVLPMVNFQLDQQAEIGQASVQIALTMNGLAPEYPVTIDYNWSINGIIAGSDVVTISGAKSGVIDYQLPPNLVTTDTITFSLVSVQNAVVGFDDTHTITLIDTNVAPIVDIEVTQNGKPTKNLHTNDGPVTVTANIHDTNQGDTHSLDWSTTDNNLSVPATGSVNTFEIDPSNLLDGNYRIGIKVVDSGALKAENEIYLRIKTQDFNPPAGTDSDHDGIEDALEGDYDDDNDGVPNYLDAIDGQPELLQMQVGQSNKSVLATQSGLSLRLGKIAQLSEKYAANLTPAELAQFANLGRVTDALDPNDSDFTADDGYLDFTINGLTTHGQSVKLVIPLLSPIPDQAAYRKYSPDTGWSNFVEDAANELSSAPGADGVCPSPGSSDYLPGLEPGEYCIQMLIEDGGPNDSDLLRNGVITDPGGVAVAKAPTTPTPTTPATSGSSGSGGGGGAIDIQLLLSMMMLLTLSIGNQVWMTRNKITMGRNRGNKPQG